MKRALDYKRLFSVKKFIQGRRRGIGMFPANQSDTRHLLPPILLPDETMVDVDKSERLHILLVEHSSERADLIMKSLDDAQMDCRIHRVADLIEAMAYLREDMPYFNAPRPDFVILGQSQEHICCCELLAEVRRNGRFAGLQTIGVKDPWWQRLPPNKAPMPFACCDINRVKVVQLGETVRDMESNSLRNLLQTYG